MILALAGKSNALIECLKFSLNFFEKENIVVIPAISDTLEDTWQFSVHNYCKKNGFKTGKIEDVYSLKNLLFVSVQYDKIINVANFKTEKIFNIHFSYLPYYKGMYPIIWPILNNDEFSGVTLHKLDRGIDTGEIIDQQKIFLKEDTTARALYFDCLANAVLVYQRNLEKLINGEFTSKDQSRFHGSYYSKKSIDFSSLTIDLNKTACEISAQFRAFIFPEYQYPIFQGVEIGKVEIQEEKSSKKAGNILEENKSCFLISSIDFNVKLFKSYNNQLFSAVDNLNTKEVQRLCTLVDDLEVKNKNGWTALMIAAFKYDFEVVKLLVENGADVNARNFKGTSVLMYAKTAAKNHQSLDILEYLIAKGANVNHSDFEGVSLISYAEQEGDSRIINYFRHI